MDGITGGRDGELEEVAFTMRGATPAASGSEK
jgi:hypothetical protein